MIRVYHHPLVIIRDKEGGPTKRYEDGVPFKAIVWPATSKLQATQYGNEINRIMNVRVDGSYTIRFDEQLQTNIYKINNILLKENDGIRIHSANKPDYKIISIKPYDHLLMEVKKL